MNQKKLNYIILLLLVYIIKFKLNDRSCLTVDNKYIKERKCSNKHIRNSKIKCKKTVSQEFLNLHKSLKPLCLMDDSSSANLQQDLIYNKIDNKIKNQGQYGGKVDDGPIKKKSNKQHNFIKKILFTAQGVKSSFQSDISIIYAYSLSIPLSILHFVFAPDLLTKIMGLIIFSLLIIFETINTSIEATVDRIGLEYHNLSKIAKDTAAIPSAIVSVIILISSGLLGYNIYLKYTKWEEEHLKNSNVNNDDTVSDDDTKKEKKYILVGKYIINSFKK